MTIDTPQRQPYRAGQTVVVLCGRAGPVRLPLRGIGGHG